MYFADVWNDLTNHINMTTWNIEGVEAFPDLTGFDRQVTDSSLFPIEYVKQSGDGDHGYHGTVFFPTTYPNGDGGVLHIRVSYYD